ncbi:hypothetical protein A9Q02_19585 [Candidatus Chloroploca asiatica]|uniref:ApeA N-terminal domain-containing protein n=1 Tax=Candidatus Chloroploca asiatica TaxID=1506545 RepID=A0A2H3KPH7_9CHLR|nr:hypothetical protein A9Q02_19585 [Candidatus Chloroploca asiatica]
MREHQLELQCSELCLHQAMSEAPQIRGPGVIRQKADGELELTLYVTDGLDPDMLWHRLAQRDELKPGLIIPSDQFYELTAFDIQGRQWTATRIEPTFIGGTGCMCRARLAEIQSRYQSEKLLVRQPSISFVFAERVSLPFNQSTTITRTVGKNTSQHHALDVFNFSNDDYEFQLSHEEAQLIVKVTAKNGGFPVQFARRVVEALQFITARPLTWTLCTNWKNDTISTSIRGLRPTTTSSRLQPPLNFSDATSEAVSDLFLCYLDHVCRDTTDHLHPISAQVRAICHASLGAVETEALVICTAIESLVPLMAQGTFQLSEDDALWVKQAQAYFDNWGGSEELTGRVKGLLANLHQPSTAMRLRKLIDDHVITRQSLQAWNRLRPRLAHGVTKRSGSLQDLLDDTQTVLTLFYRLVFFMIGYRGVYTDYTTRDWPLIQFEFPSDGSGTTGAPVSEE